jgi:hypothetical protein
VKLALYQEIVLNQDFSEYNLHRGDIATLIDYVSHPLNLEEGAVLEVFDGLGESVAVVTMPVSKIDQLQPKDCHE